MVSQTESQTVEETNNIFFRTEYLLIAPCETAFVCVMLRKNKLGGKGKSLLDECSV